MGLQQYQKQSCEIRSPTARTKRLQILHYIRNNILTAFLLQRSNTSRKCAILFSRQRFKRVCRSWRHTIRILRDLLKKYQPKNPPPLQWFSILPGVKPVHPAANRYSALLYPPQHERLLTCAPLHCLRGTGFTPFTDLIFTIFSFFFTRWQTKMMGDVLLTGSPYDQMSPPFFPGLSALHLPQFSALQRSAWNYRGRHAATWTTIDGRPAELSRNHKGPAPSPLASEAILRNPH